MRFNASEPFSVRSTGAKHPFYFASHMTGADSLPEGHSSQGDPEYVSSVPPEQWLKSYLFLTDPTYRTSHLVFIRAKTEDGTFKNVELDCVGQISGWQKLGSEGTYEFARIDLVDNGVPNGACDNGVHWAQSEAPFALTVWGWDNSVSYAYPAGMGVRPINDVFVPPVLR